MAWRPFVQKGCTVSTRVTHRTSPSGSSASALFGLVLVLVAGAVAVSAMALCESELDQLIYVCFAAATAAGGWALQMRYRRSSV